MSLFVTLEGPEGCGKTTQLQRLAAYLREERYDVLATREPGSTPIGERVRSILLDPEHTEMLPNTEFLLYTAARAQHVGQVIQPHLARGGIVLCDRYADSSLAYQGYGHQLDLAVMGIITGFAIEDVTPDLTLYLDVPVEVGLQRKAGGSGDAWNRFEQKALDFHQRVRRGYLCMAAEEPERWVVVDATRPFDEVQVVIWDLVLARLGIRGVSSQ